MTWEEWYAGQPQFVTLPEPVPQPEAYDRYAHEPYTAPVEEQ